MRLAFRMLLCGRPALSCRRKYPLADFMAFLGDHGNGGRSFLASQSSWWLPVSLIMLAFGWTTEDGLLGS